MNPNNPYASMTEAEYWRDYDIIRNEVNAAMVSCYTHRAINEIAARDMEIPQKLNRNPSFWRVTSSSLQTTLFIVLARIFDHDGSVHSIYQVLNATLAHPEFFSRAALRARKLGIPGGKWDMKSLDEYIQNAREPTTQDLRMLKKAISPHKTKFDTIYKPLRDQVFAHTVLKDEALVADLFSRTLKADIDEILRFLHSLIQAIWHLAFNAQPADLIGDNYGYARRVAEITEETERLVRQLP
jgi:hypothetical protein